MSSVNRNSAHLSTPDPLRRQSMNNAGTQPQGRAGAHIFEARVINVNLDQWTCDVTSKYDAQFYGDIPWSSPYQHFTKGQGIFFVPEVGSKCHVCIPSDGPPPYILDFIVPFETLPAGEDPQDGTSPSTGGISYSGGKPRGKFGDMGMRGVDGNFVILHRGGVLQIGCSPLGQRVFLPVSNLIHDICQNYRLSTPAGNMALLTDLGSKGDKGATQMYQVYRYDAADLQASIRLKVGTFDDAVLGPLGDLGPGRGESTYEVGKPVLEVAVSPLGFTDSGGTQQDTAKELVFKYYLDATGNLVVYSKKNIYIRTNGSFEVEADEPVILRSKKQIILESKGVAKIGGKSSTEISGEIVKVGPGTDQAAHVGSIVEITITTPLIIAGLVQTLPLPAPPSPLLPGSMIMSGQKLTGIVVTGKPNVLV